MKQFLCEILFSCALAVQPAQPIDELTYGTVLYEHFQQNYSDALVNVLVAREQQRLGEDTIRFDLAEGSFAFADGMYGYASGVFGQIDEVELTDMDRQRLAFHLSREFHRRGDWDALEQQLSKIDLGKTWLRGKQIHHPEVEYMKGELLARKGDFSGAEQHLANLDRKDALYTFGRFNLGLAYREAGQLQQAKETFEDLSKIPAYSEEAFDLAQRARLALALIAREQQDPAAAEEVLAKLPSSTRYQDIAMAAFGGLAMDNEDYELAARIWMTLQDSDYWTPATATARLGFPMSLEQLAADGRTSTQVALQQFEAAQVSFQTRLTALDTLSEQATDTAWVRDLLEIFTAPNQDAEQMQSFMEQWQAQLGHTDWLEWLSTEEVHELLLQWRDLNDMEDYLNGLPQHLEALTEVASETERRSEEANKMLRNDGLLAQRDQLENAKRRMTERLQSLVASEPKPDHAWMYALATPEERNTLDELVQMRALLPHFDEQDRERWSKRIKRLEGLFFFTIVEQRAARERAMHKQIKEMDVLIADVESHIARVADAQGSFATGVRPKLDAALARAQQMTTLVQQARLGRETLLANRIQQQMRQEQNQIAEYLLVTRIAIARATDQLALVDAGLASPGKQGVEP